MKRALRRWPREFLESLLDDRTRTPAEFVILRAAEGGHEMVKRKSYLLVCVNQRPDSTPKGSCASRGSLRIYSELKKRLKTRGLASLEARACSCSCLDACAAGPVILVQPDHFFYGGVQLSDVEEIVDSIALGRRVERLVLEVDERKAEN